MHERVRAALIPVLADLRATSDLDVRVEDKNWARSAEQPGVYLWPGGSGVGGVGVSVWLPDSELEQRVSMADQVQDWVVETIGGNASNWPVCPQHPSTHPMAARAVEGAASWVCPVLGTVIAPVGSLRSTGRRTTGR